MAPAKRNPVAAALFSSRACNPKTVRPKKGRGAYRRKLRHGAKASAE